MRDGGALPGWPRALKESWAAAYVGLSPTTFRAEIAAGRAPKPVRLTAGRVVWLREQLDAYLDDRLRDANPSAGGTDDEHIRAMAAALAAPKGRARRRPQAG